MNNIQLITKEELIGKLKEIETRGWIRNTRKGNDGAVGNVLEDLLGIPENNLPIPNAAEWELKARRANTSALLTLCHMEPSPRAVQIVDKVLLPYYGWKHQKAGERYPESEMSFRATLNSLSYTDRGLKVVVNKQERRIEISFDSAMCAKRHQEWLSSVGQRVGLGDLIVRPYWGFDDVFAKIGTKLVNCFYVEAEVKRVDSIEYFHYNKALMLKSVNLERFIDSIEQGKIYIDFDARTGHNHGTKFRIKSQDIPLLYKEVVRVV